MTEHTGPDDGAKLPPEVGYTADDIRDRDNAAGHPPALDIDPGPTLDVEVIALQDAAENEVGFLVSTLDEPLARRLIAAAVERDYGGEDAAFYITRLETASAKAGRWIEVGETDGEYTEYLDADTALVASLASRHVTIEEPFEGIRFLVDTERD